MRFILNPEEENDSTFSYSRIMTRIRLLNRVNPIKIKRITRYTIKDILYDSFCNKKNKQT